MGQNTFFYDLILGDNSNHTATRLSVIGSFISAVCHSPVELAIVDAIIKMVHSLDLRVVAEGVETEAQAAILRRLGCDLLQGYFFQRPRPAEECEPDVTRVRGWDPVKN